MIISHTINSSCMHFDNLFTLSHCCNLFHVTIILDSYTWVSLLQDDINKIFYNIRLQCILCEYNITMNEGVNICLGVHV